MQNYQDPGLAEAIRRPCSGAVQPKEYHSTIRPLVVPPSLAYDEVSVQLSEQSRKLPRPVGVAAEKGYSREQLRGAAQRIAKLASRSVSLRAPAGVGKSTCFPSDIDDAVSEVVVVMQPTEVAAQACVATATSEGKKCRYVSSVDMALEPLTKAEGVVYTTLVGMVMRAYAYQRDTSDIETPILVIHDDCQVVTSEGHFIRTMWPDMGAITKMVHVSTLDESSPDEFEMPLDSDNKAIRPVVVSIPFVQESESCLSDELPGGAPAPWSVRGVLGKKTLMYVESDRIAQHMVNIFDRVLKTVPMRRYHDYDQYKAVVAALNDPTAADGVLIIADSSLQAGVHLPVDQVVDFGYVRHTVAGAGMQPVDQVVRETEVERAARVARAVKFASGADGNRGAIAYVGVDPASNMAPGMGAGEVARVAALCRLFGYEPLPITVPKYKPELLGQADLVKFLASDLPWDVWVNMHYEPRPKCEGTVADRRAERADITSVIDWMGGVKLSVEPLELKSGQTYKDAHGAVSINQGVLNSIMAEYEDLIPWLRERIKGRGIRTLEDFTAFESHTVWLVWLTAWNWNVADLAALDKWRAEYGKAVDGWRMHAECRAKVAKVMAVAKDIHDRWMLLDAWYRDLFAVHPYQLTEIDYDADLVASRHAELLAILGRGIMPQHIMGSNVMCARPAIVGTSRRNQVTAAEDPAGIGEGYQHSRHLRYGGYGGKT